jgi:hypothetical protein
MLSFYATYRSGGRYPAAFLDDGVPEKVNLWRIH